MKRVVFGLCSALVTAVLACGGAPDDQGPVESVDTTAEAMKWTPLPDPWKDCVVNKQICRCSGDVEDCRHPRPVPPVTRAALEGEPSRVQ